MNIIEVEKLQKNFGTFQALKGIDLQVKQGEVYGFIGPNGAGKSTTIRTLLGLLKATSGQARIFGKDVWKDAVEIHKKLAYVPADVHLWPNLSGGEVIDIFLRLRDIRDTQNKQEFIERFQLDPTKKCRSYSKGNRQKVALVAAFAAEADLYILDEPTTGLDPLMEKVFQECVLEAKNKGKSVLLSSHILSEVERLCDSVGIIRQGEMIESGRLESLRHLTKMTILVETRKPLKGVKELKGVYEWKIQEGTNHLQIDKNELASLIEFVSKFEVTNLISQPPSLEELFMSHYDTRDNKLRGAKSYE
ncbi:ABC transporter ATP-binding protein [Alkalihalobacillus trypoxylicola]|uniref:ABC transporter ATP-binding protein n=1 Tax=Alkalihalobacillus trypoxylicola TaxID=519424 RepID=A0A162F090_9BACI|nr:ABC transporter ATP-binding protein [Alkalihalobacillus trypoxylicola]KYG34153.1 ABC transporter ATP-binding protein [Alkalihalobacillus trypoxylicola]